MAILTYLPTHKGVRYSSDIFKKVVLPQGVKLTIDKKTVQPTMRNGNTLEGLEMFENLFISVKTRSTLNVCAERIF